MPPDDSLCAPIVRWTSHAVWLGNGVIIECDETADGGRDGMSDYGPQDFWQVEPMIYCAGPVEFARWTARARATEALATHSVPAPASTEAVSAMSTGMGPDPVRMESVQESSAGKPVEVRIGRAEVARRLGIHPQTLDALIDSAPKNLPGSPLRIGNGKKRRHYRWKPETFEAWIEAVQAWRAGRGRRTGR